MRINEMNVQGVVPRLIWVQWTILTTIPPLILTDLGDEDLDFSHALDFSPSFHSSFRSSFSGAVGSKLR